ncbi:MAG TPA: HAMP domain-containing sensor histidine kinase [Caulobacteraceae bacterium]|nr:HAMP domain-containing sensor histidine kinase [Caulobacteraceae bacterium]
MSFDPTSPEPPRARGPSAFLRLAAIYVAAFAVSGVLFVAGAVHLVSSKNLERTQALILADREAVLDKIDGGSPELRFGKAMAIVLARGARPDDGRVYRLERGGMVAAGDIPAKAVLTARDGGWLTIRGLEGGRARGLALRESLGGGATLLIGRAYEDELQTELVSTAAAALALAALAALLVGPWASGQILKRVQAVNEACDRVRAGDFSARAPGAEARDEFGALAGHVNAMLERIDGLVVGLRDVSNRIAHDLRTPMARLRSDLEAARDAKDLKEARRLTSVAIAETDEILETFSALLDIAEAEAGADAGLEALMLDDAAEAAVDLYQAVADDAGVRLVFEREPCPILGERSLVIRLAANLIDNAIKFSPRGGTVQVRVEQADGWARLTVEDQGPGVPEAEREQVWRRFTRGRDVGSTPGHGLGLALVAAVAKRHGARIELEDARPGLRMRVRFPAFAPTPGM